MPNNEYKQLEKLFDAKLESLDRLLDIKFENFEKILAVSEKQNASRRHETLALVTKMKATHEERYDKQDKFNNRIVTTISIMGVLLALSILGMASEAGSLLGIIINAF